jgi:hypothetical protein
MTFGDAPAQHVGNLGRLSSSVPNARQIEDLARMVSLVRASRSTANPFAARAGGMS